MSVGTSTAGAESPACITCSTRMSFFPASRRDAGWRSPPARKPFSTSRVIASASPSASAAVVLAVGTRFSGQASSATWQSRATSAHWPSVDACDAGQGDRSARRCGASSRAAGGPRRVSPLCESATTTSSGCTTPRSPWMASAGCRKKAGVPVLDERRRDLPRDDARLAHAGDDHAAAAVAQQLDGADEALVEALDEREDGVGLGPQHLLASARSGRTAPRPRHHELRGDRIDLHQLPQQRLEPVERSAFWRVAPGAGRILVHFQEDAVHAGADAGAGERRRCTAPAPPSRRRRRPAAAGCASRRTPPAQPSSRIIGKARMSTTRLL